jgi:ABC-2 type transport system ATP-binding protein
LIEIKNLRKRYDDGTVALKGINLKINEKVATVIGRNGAGKTTMMRILSTQLLPTSGTAKIKGYDVVKEPERIRRIAVSIPQEAGPLGFLTPMEHLLMYLAARKVPVLEARQDAAKALREIELWDARNTPADMLSGGMKRKIFVAMALASNAEVVFLDEPTTGLDPLSRLEVWSAIKLLDSEMVITTHYMEEAQELSKEVVMIEGGKCVSHGNVASMLKKFNGLVRAETNRPGAKTRYRVGSMGIDYIKKGEALDYIKEGYAIKQITLDDLFVMKGVELES